MVMIATQLAGTIGLVNAELRAHLETGVFVRWEGQPWTGVG